MFRIKPTRISALIGASPPAGVERANTGWSLVVYLAARRLSATDVEERSIRCELPESRSAMQRHMQALAPYDVVELEISDASDPARLLLRGIRKAKKPDPELAAIAARLQVPVVVQHPELGRLTYDRRSESFGNEVSWLGIPVNLDIEAPEADADSAGIRHAAGLFAEQETWTPRVAGFAADRLLTLKNENWLGENESPVTRDEFIARMQLESLWVGEAGDFAFYFADGDLFWGHWIDVSGTLADGPTRADIGG